MKKEFIAERIKMSSYFGDGSTLLLDKENCKLAMGCEPEEYQEFDFGGRTDQLYEIGLSDIVTLNKRFKITIEELNED